MKLRRELTVPWGQAKAPVPSHPPGMESVKPELLACSLGALNHWPPKLLPT